MKINCNNALNIINEKPYCFIIKQNIIDTILLLDRYRYIFPNVHIRFKEFEHYTKNNFIK